MSMMNQNKIADTQPQPVFYLNHMLLLPDYANKHRWVGPGRKKDRAEFTTATLLDAGAKLSVMPLWGRHWTDEIKGWKTT